MDRETMTVHISIPSIPSRVPTDMNDGELQVLKNEKINLSSFSIVYCQLIFIISHGHSLNNRIPYEGFMVQRNQPYRLITAIIIVVTSDVLDLLTACPGTSTMPVWS